MTVTVRIETNQNFNTTFAMSLSNVFTCVTFSDCKNWRMEQAKRFLWTGLPSGVYIEFFEMAECDYYNSRHFYITPQRVWSSSFDVPFGFQTFKSFMLKRDAKYEAISQTKMCDTSQSHEIAVLHEQNASTNGSASPDELSLNWFDPIHDEKNVDEFP